MLAFRIKSFLSAGEGALAQNPPINDDVSRPHAKSPFARSSGPGAERGRAWVPPGTPRGPRGLGGARRGEGHPGVLGGLGWGAGTWGRVLGAQAEAGTGCWVLSVGRVWGAGHWQGAGHWIQAGCWVLGAGWVLEIGWVLDMGCWGLDRGWVLGARCKHGAGHGVLDMDRVLGAGHGQGAGC